MATNQPTFWYLRSFVVPSHFESLSGLHDLKYGSDVKLLMWDNPTDRGAWKPTVPHGVPTQLKWFSACVYGVTASSWHCERHHRFCLCLWDHPQGKRAAMWRGLSRGPVQIPTRKAASHQQLVLTCQPCEWAIPEVDLPASVNVSDLSNPSWHLDCFGRTRVRTA